MAGVFDFLWSLPRSTSLRVRGIREREAQTLSTSSLSSSRSPSSTTTVFKAALGLPGHGIGAASRGRASGVFLGIATNDKQRDILLIIEVSRSTKAFIKL